MTIVVLKWTCYTQWPFFSRNQKYTVYKCITKKKVNYHKSGLVDKSPKCNCMELQRWAVNSSGEICCNSKWSLINPSLGITCINFSNFFKKILSITFLLQKGVNIYNSFTMTNNAICFLKFANNFYRNLWFKTQSMFNLVCTMSMECNMLAISFNLVWWGNIRHICFIFFWVQKVCIQKWNAYMHSMAALFTN